jgi:hypothetical protein
MEATLRVASAQKQLGQVLHYEWDGAGWEYASRTNYTYANDLLSVREEERHAAAGMHVPVSRERYEYDAQGRLLHEYDEVWDTQAGAYRPVSRASNFYVGSATFATAVQYYEWDDDLEDYEPVDRQTFTTATENGFTFITSGESLEWDGSDWTPVDRFMLMPDGSDVLYIEQLWTGSDWENYERVRYLNLTVPQLYERFLQLMEHLELHHGSLLMLGMPDAVYEAWDGDDWVYEGRQVTENWYEFQTGALLRSEAVREAWEDDEWLVEGRLVISYEMVGSNSRPDSLWFDIAVGEDEWMSYMHETYKYNSEGDIEEIDFFVLGFSGELEPVTSNTFIWREVGVSIEEGSLATTFALQAAYPNPFNPSTTIAFTAAATGDVVISVYDILGRHVTTIAAGQYQAGEHRVVFDAGGLPSGTYLVRLESGGLVQSRSITLIK